MERKKLRLTSLMAILVVSISLQLVDPCNGKKQSKKSAKPPLYRLQVTGQEEFQLRKNQNPCAVLTKYSQDIAQRAQMEFSTVFNQLYDTILEQLIKLWDSIKAHKELKVDDSFFVRCEPVTITSEWDSKLTAQMTQVPSTSRKKRHKTLLGMSAYTWRLN